MSFNVSGIVNSLNRIVEKLGALIISIGGDDADYVCKLYQSTLQSIPTSTWTKISLQSKSFDPENCGDITNYKWTCSKSGYYNIIGALGISTGVGRAVIKIYKNGSFFIKGSDVLFTSYKGLIVSGIEYIEKGDYLELYALQASGGALDSIPTDEITYLSVAKINPQNRSLNEEDKNACHYIRESAQSIANGSWTNLQFNVKKIDNENSYDPATYKWICQETGFYNISGGVGFVPATGISSLSIKKNNSVYLSISSGDLNATNNRYISTSVTGVYLEKGDYIQIQALQASGGALNTLGTSTLWCTFLSIIKN